MSILVTGGAGFIGSCIVRSLNDRGRYDLIISDNTAGNEKWRNLSPHRFLSYIPKGELTGSLVSGSLGNIEAVIHMGACSSTTVTDWDYLYHNNFEYTRSLWEYCASHDIPFIYASSAATYGDGSKGFDDECNIGDLKPLNAYGRSKQKFDLWARDEAKTMPPQHVGLKFFNVYGPNEYFKGTMASMVYHGYKQIRKTGRMKLFRSYDPKYEDGGQLRDFIYVMDICDVVLWFIDHPDVSGLYNVGTGRASSFRELAETTFSALGLTPAIEYIDMPDNIRPQYQYFTQASIAKLRAVGYDKPFTPPDEGMREYVKEYLDKGFKIY